MPAQNQARRKKGIFCAHRALHIAQPLRPGAKAGRDRKNTAHGPEPALALNAAGQQHETAAFRINGQSPCGQMGQKRQTRRKAQLPREIFGKTAAQVKAVQIPPGIGGVGGLPASAAVQQGQADQFRARLGQRLKIFLIIEPERRVTHIPDTRSRKFHRGGSVVRGVGKDFHAACGTGRRVPLRRVRRKGRGPGRRQHLRKIQMLTRQSRQTIQTALGVPGQRVAATGNAHVPFGQRIFRQTRQRAQHGQIRIGFKGMAQQVFMPGRAHLVEHHAAEPQARFKTEHALNQRGRRAGHLGAVQAEQNGAVQNAGQLRRGAGTPHIQTVKQAPVAFHQPQNIPRVSRQRGHGADKKRAQPGGRQKKGIQIGGRSPGCQSQPGRVDVIRPFFKGSNRYPGVGQRPRHSEREQRLAAPAGQGGHAEPGQGAGKLRRGGRKSAHKPPGAVVTRD